MRYTLRLAIAALAAAILLAPLRADAHLTIVTVNRSGFPVWITIQDLGKTRNLDWGRVEPHSRRSWASGGYTIWGEFFVRYQFMSGSHTVCDTRMKIHMHNGPDKWVSGWYDAQTGRCWIQYTSQDPR